jgi:hypothetical protein
MYHRKIQLTARQKGYAVMLTLLLVFVGGAGVLFSLASPANSRIAKDKVTAAALAQAKQALIGYASGGLIGSPTAAMRPGDLPCPDMDNDGITDTPCGSGAGSNQQLRLGRLPWKELGLPDLRDGDGERLWYAVSNNFKKSTRTACNAPGAPGCLNSDTRGTITLRNSAGAVIHDGGTSSGVIAVIFSPGSVLQRQGSATPQNRDCAIAGNCANPVNYLDVLTGVEDNADFVDSSSTNGFIQGEIRDGNGDVVVNDRLLTITYEDLMPKLELRVAGEVLRCLTSYAAAPANNGRYPWAAGIVESAGGDYHDKTDTRFGRVPDEFPLSPPFDGFERTRTTSGEVMIAGWAAGCNIIVGTWWNNWKELVFYAIADGYKPVAAVAGTLPPPAPGCASCLTVNPPSAAGDKQLVVMVSGRTLASIAPLQARNSAPLKSDPYNYLENENNWTAPGPFTADRFLKQSVSATFNDVVLFR